MKKNSISTKIFFFLSAKFIYSVFFIIGGFYLLYQSIWGNSNNILFILSFFLILTGIVLVLPKKLQNLFILKIFKDSHISMFFLWISLPFIILSVAAFISNKAIKDAVISLIIGSAFIILSFIIKRYKTWKSNVK